MDFCKFFQAIEKDPLAPVDITVGEFLQAAEHVDECATCRDVHTRVLRRGDDEGRGIPVSLN
jgi:predicted anti-sigma-YlaC factor YlaD